MCPYLAPITPDRTIPTATRRLGRTVGHYGTRPGPRACGRPEAEARPEAKTLIAAVRAVEKAGRVAGEVGNGELAKALDAAQAALAPAIVSVGLRLPEKARRGAGASSKARTCGRNRIR